MSTPLHGSKRIPETEAFWNCAKEGTLLIGTCPSCHQDHYYPRAVCPFCSCKTEMKVASGRGQIYSFSVMRRVPIPYVIAFVTLEEGVTMMTNITDCSIDAVAIGKKVEAVFKPVESGQIVPMFRLSA
jgi:uncharacterized protein